MKLKNKHLIWGLRLNDDIKHKRVILHQTKNSKIFIAEYVES